MSISRRQFLLATSGGVTGFLLPSFYKKALDARPVLPLAWILDLDLEGPDIRTTTEFWIHEIPKRPLVWRYRTLGQRMLANLESLRRIRYGPLLYEEYRYRCMRLIPRVIEKCDQRHDFMSMIGVKSAYLFTEWRWTTYIWGPSAEEQRYLLRLTRDKTIRQRLGFPNENEWTFNISLSQEKPFLGKLRRRA